MSAKTTRAQLEAQIKQLEQSADALLARRDLLLLDCQDGEQPSSKPQGTQNNRHETNLEGAAQ